jgi:hypothetical protein
VLRNGWTLVLSPWRVVILAPTTRLLPLVGCPWLFSTFVSYHDHCRGIFICTLHQLLMIKWRGTRLVMFISLSTQSGDFWIHLRNYKPFVLLYSWLCFVRRYPSNYTWWTEPVSLVIARTQLDAGVLILFITLWPCLARRIKDSSSSCKASLYSVGRPLFRGHLCSFTTKTKWSFK